MKREKNEVILCHLGFFFGVVNFRGNGAVVQSNQFFRWQLHTALAAVKWCSAVAFYFSTSYTPLWGQKFVTIIFTITYCHHHHMRVLFFQFSLHTMPMLWFSDFLRNARGFQRTPHSYFLQKKVLK